MQSFIRIEEIFIFIWDKRNSIFSYTNFKKLLEEVDLFLNEHLPNKFISNFPKLIHSTKWKFDYILATKKSHG